MASQPMKVGEACDSSPVRAKDGAVLRSYPDATADGDEGGQLPRNKYLRPRLLRGGGATDGKPANESWRGL